MRIEKDEEWGERERRDERDMFRRMTIQDEMCLRALPVRKANAKTFQSTPRRIQVTNKHLLIVVWYSGGKQL